MMAPRIDSWAWACVTGLGLAAVLLGAAVAQGEDPGMGIVKGGLTVDAEVPEGSAERVAPSVRGAAAGQIRTSSEQAGVIQLDENPVPVEVGPAEVVPPLEAQDSPRRRAAPPQNIDRDEQVGARPQR